MEEDPFSELYQEVKRARGEKFAQEVTHGYRKKPNYWLLDDEERDENDERQH